MKYMTHCTRENSRVYRAELRFRLYVTNTDTVSTYLELEKIKKEKLLACNLYPASVLLTTRVLYRNILYATIDV